MNDPKAQPTLYKGYDIIKESFTENYRASDGRYTYGPFLSEDAAKARIDQLTAEK